MSDGDIRGGVQGHAAVRKWHPPSERETEVTRNKWKARFYGGFARRIAVHDQNDKEIEEIYTQEEKRFFCLPEPQAEPDPHHVLQIEGGPHGRRATITVFDPALEIAEIRVTFKTVDRRNKERELVNDWLGKGGGVVANQGGGGETVVFTGGSTLCPPTCPTGVDG